MIPPPGAAPSPTAREMGVIATAARPGVGRPAHALPRHLIETTARPFLPPPRHRCPMRSRTLAPGLSPNIRSASGVSSPTWWQADLHEVAPFEILDPRDVLWDRGCRGSCCGQSGP